MRIAYLLPSLDRKGPVIMVSNLVRNLKDKVETIDVCYFNEPREVEFPVNTRKLLICTG